MSNLGMIPKAIIHLLVQFEACKTWSYVTPWFQGKEKIFNQNQIGDECVEDLLH
jgi:hypothetical protein